MNGLLNEKEKSEKNIKIEFFNKQIDKYFSTIFKHKNSIDFKYAKKHLDIVKQDSFKIFNNKNQNSTISNYILNTKYCFNEIKNTNNKKYKLIKLPIDAYCIVLINGNYNLTLSSIDMGPFCISHNYNLLPKEINSNFFLHLIECLSTKPLIIYLPKNKITKKPLYLLNISYGNDNKQITNFNQYRYHLIIDSNSKTQVIEHFTSLNKQMYITGSRLTVNIKNNSELNHFKLNIENNKAKHFAHNDIVIGCNSIVKSNSFLFGTSLIHNYTSSCFNKKHSKLELNSLLLTKNNGITNIQTYVEHKNGHCKSEQLHKIIAIGNSKTIFNGLIKINPLAIKTKSKMINNTLLLGKKSEISSTPQLEIYADDVKCNHGVTIDYIDKNQLFYIRSRGIDNQTAIHMIITAVTSKLINQIDSKELKNIVISNLYKIF